MRAAFYEADITPPIGGFYWGHYAPTLAKGVRERLYAKAMVSEVNGEIFAVVCIDSCTLPADMHDAVVARVEQYTAIPASHVALCSNHTHWGVPIGDSPELNCYADAAYRDVCYRLTADAIILAYGQLDTAEVAFGHSALHGYAFCRDYMLESGRAVTFNGKNEPVREMLSEIDPEVCVMTYLRDGKPIGALINYSLHQCTCGPCNEYSGDYASTLSKKLKERYGADFVSVFLLGTCGDINHVNTDHIKPYHTEVQIGEALAVQAGEAIENAVPVIADALIVKKELITLEKRQAEKYETRKRLAELCEKGDMMRARNLMYYHTTNTETHTALWLQTVQLGDAALYFMPGEIFVDFGKEIKARSGAKHVMVVENSNSYCGYVPTARAFEADCDLYETSLCHHSCLVPEAGAQMVEKLLEMQP